MAGGGGSSPTPSNTTQTLRQAPYLESAHEKYIRHITLMCTKYGTVESSPFALYDDINPFDFFIGMGMSLSDAQSLLSLHKTLLIDFDVNNVFNSMLNSLKATASKDAVKVYSDELDYELSQRLLPELSIGARDLGVVNSSSFLIAKTLLLNNKVKALTTFKSNLELKMIEVANDLLKVQLQHNTNVVSTYSALMQILFDAKLQTDEINYKMLVKNILWPFTIAEYERIGITSMSSSQTTSTDVAGGSPSQLKNSAGMALGGAAAGFMMGAMKGSIGGAPGAVIGGLAGLALSFIK